MSEQANQTGQTEAGRVETPLERWLARAERVIRQYERDEKRAQWMFQKMQAFARIHGKGLATVREETVLGYLELLTRRGQKDWQVIQALESICILLSHGCGRENVRMPVVREHWLERRATLESRDFSGEFTRDDRIVLDCRAQPGLRTAGHSPTYGLWTVGHSPTYGLRTAGLYTSYVRN